MGLFGKLFEKKYCTVCGAEIGLLGNTKLTDGENLCKACVRKLSPWYSGIRSADKASILAQLSCREENLARVQAFHTTTSLGRGTKVLLDEEKGQFTVARTDDILSENPDILDDSQVTGCDVDIQESRREEKRRNSEGKYVPYVPPRYTYSYDFYIIIHVNHPYFNEMRFRLNPSSITIDSSRVSAFASNRTVDPMSDQDYVEFYTMANEIKTRLTGMHAQVIRETAAANAPKTAVRCPWCGATVIPDAKGCCEYCGGSLNG